MNLLDFSDLYNLISRGTENITARKEARHLRKAAFNSTIKGQGFSKIAFDTRRIDQETQFIPRRGLQNYHRSEQFVSDALHQKIGAFNKLNKVLEKIKSDLGREPEWQDSYARVLASVVQKSLRVDQADGDFSDSQPAMSSMAYLEELLYVRYRVTPNDLSKLSEDSLTKIILRKDEALMRKTSDQHNEPQLIDNHTVSYQEPNDVVLPPVPSYQEITPADVSKYSYQDMLEKIISSVTENIQKQIPSLISQQSPKADTITVANQDKQEIINKNSNGDDRTITITIKG